MMKIHVFLLFLFSFFTLANESKINFSGDAFIRGYFKNGTGPDHEQAMNQFFRLNADARPDDHLAIKTGLILSSDTWEGDNHTTNAQSSTSINDNGAGKSTVTHLDHAIIEYSNEGTIASFGRHAVSSPGNFLTADDRRDRIQLLKFFPSNDVLAVVYDVRAAGSLSNTRDDLDMYSLNYYGTYKTFKYALQTGYWINKKFTTDTFNNVFVNLDNVKQFTPQLSTKFFETNIDLYYTILWGGNAVYRRDHHAFAAKLTHDFDLVKTELETIYTRNGGLVATGFDSLSSVVNNNPEHSQSSINLRNIGSGLGASTADESMTMLRLTKALHSNLLCSLGLGTGQFYISSTKPIEHDTIFDATVKYTLSKFMDLNFKYGKFFGDFKDHASSASLNARF